MSLFARARGRHTRCSGWGDLALMVAAYRACPAREVTPAPVPLISRAALARAASGVSTPTPEENR